MLEVNKEPYVSIKFFYPHNENKYHNMVDEL